MLTLEKDQIARFEAISAPRVTTSRRPAGSMSASDDEWSDEGHARKRPRLSTEHHDENEGTRLQKRCRILTQRLSGRPVNDLIGLSRTSP